MISILLSILKIIGIVLLIVLLAALILLSLVLFVPVRYTIKADRGIIEDAPVHLKVKVTWLLHLINVCFDYPKAAYVRARVAFIPIYRSDREKQEEGRADAGSKESAAAQRQEGASKEEKAVSKITQEMAPKGDAGNEDVREALSADAPKEASGQEKVQEQDEAVPKKRSFFQKLFSALKNSKYTISKICDKIKQVIRDIRYYIKVIQSEAFLRAYDTCRKEVLRLLKGIRPQKVKGRLVVGTGDPAGTGQVLAAYGILYPLIGDNIVITPDFEQQILEGELFIKGRITVYRLLRTVWKIYFSKDIRRVLRLLKREAA